jgi:uncharacterized secreted protein with C-terminal beta-propeller domain
LKQTQAEEIQIVTQEPRQSASTPYFRLAAGVLIVAGIITSLLIAIGIKNGKLNLPVGNTTISDLAKLEVFKSPEEFKEYLSLGASLNSSSITSIGGGMSRDLAFDQAVELAAPTAQSALQATPERVSETNIQVAGVDEPDVVKTDGQNIFYSGFFDQFLGTPEPAVVEQLMLIDDVAIAPGEPFRTPDQETKIISAFPPAVLNETSTVSLSGDLLYKDNILVIFEGNTVTGINVTDKSSPKEDWRVDLNEQSIITSRLVGDTIYVITNKSINYDSPCPIPLATIGSESISIPCSRIYHPVEPINTQTTYQIFAINIQSGEIKDSVAFTGDWGASVVYATPQSIYLTYTGNLDPTPIMIDFFTGPAGVLLPSSVTQKIGELSGYDISNQAKAIELQSILEKHLSTLSVDERKKLESNLENQLKDFAQSKIRDFQTTGIVKVNLNDLQIASSGTVPGRPLNQYSLDEYDGNLRIATTVDSNWTAATDSVNDIYILDNSLKIIGSITDLGIDEQIYSARFIGDKGYLVTFKQIDPFYVLDLKKPRSPRVAGELKIPGFSSYLHPLDDNTILGIGNENGRVKVSMFNVQDPANPTEQAKYTLDEFWTEVGSSAHAFLLDTKHKAFFMPAGQSGYIFSYDDQLILERVVGNTNAQRAIFINDYLYVIGTNKIVALNESDWTDAGSLSF